MRSSIQETESSKRQTKFSQRQTEQGIGLIEVSIALLIFLVALLTLAQAITVSIALNKKSREVLIANTLCKDKIEQLLSLDYDDIKTNTTVDPVGGPPLKYPLNGVGLADGGSLTPAAPVPFYNDSIDTIGQRVITIPGFVNPNRTAFVRQWLIESFGSVKRIQVTVVGPSSYGLVTTATMVAFKSQSQ